MNLLTELDNNAFNSCLEQERNLGVRLWLNLVGHGGQRFIEALEKLWIQVV